MEIIQIRHVYSDNKFVVVDKINQKLAAKGIQIELFEYDDNRVYQTQERARDARLDCTGVPGEARPAANIF